MSRLSGKVVVITGAARGMGAAHVRRFVAEGAKVVFTDILEEEGRKLQAELGANSLFIQHNVTNESEWKAVIEQAEAAFGPVDVLVNNAGIDLPPADLDAVPVEQYRKVIDVNQLSVFLGMRYVVPSMKKAGGGSIVNVSSLAGIVGAYKKIAYTASKFAVRGMTKAAALELGEFGIRVNSVHPGFIRTPMTEALINPELEASFPIRRVGQPEEVTNLVLYLASDESSYSTGSEFVIDGGLGAQ
ncbi:glucose 1-dehydrogenase [Cohnella thailandensis]|uniref:Glucose 1-dehydrogenase n=1 Tax=Cohnella thailandensis TaxID=557557 RepID=A0A841SPR7_9BACL|nr:glucose 1-dehydrogenase [Cohnella thailandensis]MBB6632819.1 glucose 1-dehydrogenase [Cohnella thailandensis]MBP1975489.1 3alpha(or 20beta)-hydroxysteroid dehydrogenase [Cohnella thailandensis]